MPTDNTLIADAVNADVTTPAGFWRRVGATLLDGGILILLQLPIGALVGNSQSLALGFLRDGSASLSPEALKRAAVGFSSELVIRAIYCALFYRAMGATPGKFLLGMRVISIKTGAFLGVGQTILREIIGKWLSFLPLMLGFLMVPFRKDKRALHDLIAGTQVVIRK